MGPYVEGGFSWCSSGLSRIYEKNKSSCEAPSTIMACGPETGSAFLAGERGVQSQFSYWLMV